MADDGYNTTVTFDCGCSVRLNEQPQSGVPYRVGDWGRCPTGQHSGVYDYDPATGDPNLQRDRRVTEVERDA